MINASSSIVPIPNQRCECYRIVIEPMPPLYIHECTTMFFGFTSVRPKPVSLSLCLHFELLDECSEMPRHGSR